MALTKIPGNLIQSGAITAAALDNDAVTTAKILDANITHAKLHTSMDLTGKTVTVATAAGSTNTTAAASTAFVQQELTTLIGGAPGTLDTLNELAAAINDDSNYNTTLTTALATKLPLAGGTMTGNLIGTQAFFSPNTAGKNTITITTNAVDDGRIIIKSDTTDKVDIQANGTTYFNGGNVGIGTGSPNEKLEVAGSIRLANMKIQNVSSGRIGFNRNTATGAIYDSGASAFQINGPFTGSDYLDFQSYNSAGTYVDSMVIKDGNVGIGDTSPSVKLDVYQSTVGTGAADFRHVNGNRILLNPSYNYHDAYNHIFRGLNGTNTHMTIDNNGNVGIGTGSPSGLLDIKGNFESVYALKFNNTQGTDMVSGFRSHGGNGEAFSFYHDGDRRQMWDSNGSVTFENGSNVTQMYIGPTGNVGIGTTSAAVALEIGLDNSSASVGYIRLRGHNTVEGNIYKDATYSIHMDTNSNNGPIRIDGSKQILGITGNVGIGTESPAKKLHVRTTADGTLQRFSRHGVCDWDVSIGNTPIITGGSAGDLEIMPQNANMGFAVGRAGQTGINMRVRDGVMTLGSGIKFNGDTAAANELDDYEEGTWIPDLRNGTTSLSTQTWAYGPTAVYTKVGDLVYIHLAGKLSSVAGTGGGELRIFGLPFMPQTTGGYQEYRVNFILGNSVHSSDSGDAFAFVRNGGTDLGTRILDGGDTVFTTNRLDSDTFFSCYGCYKT